MSARPFGVFFDAIAARLGYKIAGPLDFLARYPGRVAAQSSDLTRVDVQLDIDVEGSDRRMPSPSNISIRLGLPGVLVGIQTGCRVLVGWEQGDPDKPYIADWELGATLTSMAIAGGTLQSARRTDPIEGGSISASSILAMGVTTVTVFWIPTAAPSIPVPVLIMTFAAGLLTGTVPAPNAAPVVVPVTGSITAGSGIVKVG